MITIERENFVELTKIIEDLRIKSEGGAIIVVEGIKDERALRKLGVTGRIVKVASLSKSDILDILSDEEVIIMTDWDEKGMKIEKNLLSLLSFRADISYKRKISKIVGKITSEVETLYKIVEDVEKRSKLFKP